MMQKNQLSLTESQGAKFEILDKSGSRQFWDKKHATKTKFLTLFILELKKRLNTRNHDAKEQNITH